MTTGTASTQAHVDMDTGLIFNHAYTVLGAVTLSNGQKLIKLRNPWGREEYKGNWSDTDSRWTDALRAEVNIESNVDDGIFFVPLEDFQIAFARIGINVDNSNWQGYDYFLKLDETTTGNAESGYCGAHCTRKELYVYSPGAA